MNRTTYTDTAMEFEIRLFATLRDLAGASQIQLAVEDPATVERLLAAVGETYPALSAMLPVIIVAVNKVYAGPEMRINKSDDIALFPPVSGGAADPRNPTYFSITEDEIDFAEVFKAISTPDIGSIVTFSGFVRGETYRAGYPSSTLHLEYEAYEEMALDKMNQIAREIWERWPKVRGVAIIQRIGKLDVGESTTVVA